jgi:hypothetical protein
MAKTISDEQMKLSIIINGNSAQKRTFDLEEATLPYQKKVRFKFKSVKCNKGKAPQNKKL